MKNLRLNELFENWSLDSDFNRRFFISDGIFNENQYNSAPIKILFIAKESNDNTQYSWDYREEIDEVFQYPFFKTLGLWSAGILNNFPEIDTFTDDDLRSAINQIAFMNVKKCGGGGRSISKEITFHIKTFKNYILSEIEIIGADIILFSLSNINLINMLFEEKINWEITKNGYEVAKINYNNRYYLLINNYHPSARIEKNKMYMGLKGVFKDEVFTKYL